MEPHRFPESPLDAVAHHRLTECTGDGKANPRSVRLRLADAKRRKQRTGMPVAIVINAAEILGSQQTDTFRKTSDGVTTSRS